jgi:hypothetical protein
MTSLGLAWIARDAGKVCHVVDVAKLWEIAHVSEIST